MYENGPQSQRDLKHALAKLYRAQILRQWASESKPADAKGMQAEAAKLERLAQKIYDNCSVQMPDEAAKLKDLAQKICNN